MLAQLPPELLGLVFEYLPQQKCRDLRLVSRIVSAASTPHAFECLSISIFTRSLQRLHAISLSPLARHVKSLEYHPDLLPSAPALSKITWLSLVDQSGRFRSLSDAQIMAEWLDYTALFSAQKRWLEEIEGVLLSESLVGFPNLSQVSVERVRNRFVGNRLLEMNDDRLCSGLRKDISEGRIGECKIGWLCDENREHEEREFSLMLAFVEATGFRNQQPGMRPVETLHIDMLTNYSFSKMIKVILTSDPAHGEHDSRYQAVLDLFRPLKALKLSCPHVDKHSFWPAIADDQGQAEEVRRFLSLTTNLRSLDLDYGAASQDIFMDFGDFHLHFSLLPFLSDPKAVYPNLHTLRIEGMVPGKAFADFLTHHAASLRRVKIYHSMSDDWEAVWTAIARELTLDNVDIFRVYSATTKPLDAKDPNRGSYVDGVAHFGDREGHKGNELVDAMQEYFASGGEGGLPNEYFKEAVRIKPYHEIFEEQNRGLLAI